ncbi:NAD kinase [Pseudactinotalea sp. HY160]|uniref:NAD kinase n=1 Tax=Pseudactinotalea sp. HY160 TaxID=2654490 RepID=UPI00128D05B2|nr:NAD kinase [Pseudactinotalea sp. HY160]MPV49816.1 NAD kinase [Pseudactinotalea sp. HY160]
MSRRVLVFTHPTRPQASVLARTVAQDLATVGMEPVPAEEIDDGDYELAIVLGGDGSILRAAEVTRGRGIPIIGVNLGHVGFLAESEVDHASEVVRRAAERDYHVDERMTLEVTVQRPGERVPERGWAINEATVEKTERDRMIEVAIGIDGRGVSTFGCDAVVLATPTGSTAYAFSGGGPIVWPNVEALLLVPISAHALFTRPIVVGPASVMAVEILGRSYTDGVVWCDGRRAIAAPAGSHVEVVRGTEPVRLARFGTGPFTDRLVKKFDLPVTGWRGSREEGE